MSPRLEAGNDTPLPDAQMLAWWALGFTPRVACLEDAVVLEWQASQRLFGGRRALMRQLEQGAEQAGCQGWGHARTALGALALARTPRPHPRQLDALPLTSLRALATHEATLSRMGCRTLGDVAHLPRDGVSRRFGAAVLQALDQARSVAPEAFTWLSLPPVFDARLELPGRVDQADALQPACDWLLARLGAWLVARHMGVRSFTLRWQHDGQRRDAARSGEHTVRLGTATADVVRLRRLVAEHLRRLALLAPVGEISLHAADIAPVEACEDDLFLAHSQDVAWHADAWQTPAGRRHQHDALTALLERLSVRLGSERVRTGQLQDDHRLGLDQAWLPWAPQGRSPSSNTPGVHHGLPHPAWVLPVPQPLHTEQDASGQVHPLYHGRLALLAGPHRMDTGWWGLDAANDAIGIAPAPCAPTCQVAEPAASYDVGQGITPVAPRDYFLAHSPRAGLLWVFRTRANASRDAMPSPVRAMPAEAEAWFLHGLFA